MVLYKYRKEVKKMVKVQEVRNVLNSMGYHKTDIFIDRLQVESDHDENFTEESIKSVAWSMLDRDWEGKLLRRLGI